jgi:hypothetical protein
MEVDHEIEQFWLNFKGSLHNFYKVSVVKFTRPIEKWCLHLNNLQQIQEYGKIEEAIIKYISLYAVDLMRVHDTYNMNILASNIKRWDEISRKYKIFSCEENEACNIIFVLTDIYIMLMTKGKLKHELFDDLELFLFFNDYRTLIEFSVDHNTPSILEKLMKYNPLIFYQIQSRYNLSRAIKPPISGNKLFKLIKSANK